MKKLFATQRKSNIKIWVLKIHVHHNPKYIYTCTVHVNNVHQINWLVCESSICCGMVGVQIRSFMKRPCMVERKVFIVNNNEHWECTMGSLFCHVTSHQKCCSSIHFIMERGEGMCNARWGWISTCRSILLLS